MFYFMDKYKKLASNTFIFALGTFSSKVLVFLMMPFYTRVMSSESYGIVDIIVQTCTLLIPLASIGINNGVIRFGLERKLNQKSVFTFGFLTIMVGFGIMLLCRPLLLSITVTSQYTDLMIFYVLMSCLQGLCSQFARARGYIRLYAIDGIFRTLMTILLNVIFLVGFQMGIVGYILSTILTDALSTVFIFLIARLHRYFSLVSLKRSIALGMLKYSIPLIPNTVCSWIISISDRYLITYLIGSSANGIYAIANKIPTILMIVANIFSEAWQISAVGEEGQAARERFFSKVLNVYQSVAFLTAAILIATAKITTFLLASPEFYEAWQYIPFLVLATTFSCLASFLSSVYMVEKKSIHTLITTFLSALLNIGLNILWIPKYGIFGAAFATFLSYLVMFFIRAIHTRKYIKIRWNLGKFLLNFILVIIQSTLMMNEVPGWIFYEIFLALFVVIINMKPVMQSLRRILKF